MSWIQIGPDFVFNPRNSSSSSKRLSLHNEYGVQGRILDIAIDPNNQDVIYVIESDSNKLSLPEQDREPLGAAIFRKRATGWQWDSIADMHTRISDTQPLPYPFIPTCIAVNPSDSNIIYMGTRHGRVYKGTVIQEPSGDITVNWESRSVGIAGTPVRKLIFARYHASPDARGHIYAATNQGVYRTIDGGRRWERILVGNVTSLVGYFPRPATPQQHPVIYAGIWRSGVQRLNEDENRPANVPGTWVNLSTKDERLPTPNNQMLPLHYDHPTTDPRSMREPHGNFNHILIDYCPLNPNRVYVWMFNKVNDRYVTAYLYRASDPTRTWERVQQAPDSIIPDPYQGLTAVFSISPNSSEDGSRDILFFGNIGISRSTDGGRSWRPPRGPMGEVRTRSEFHADMHSIAFFPDPRTGSNLATAQVPEIYIGCDGGIGTSSNFANADFSIDVQPINFNEGLDENQAYDDFKNLNHGKQSNYMQSYVSHPDISTIGYIGCIDTGIAACSGSLGWRCLANADVTLLAAAPSSNGVKIWFNHGQIAVWPFYRVSVILDLNGYSPYAGTDDSTTPPRPRFPIRGVSDPTNALLTVITNGTDWIYAASNFVISNDNNNVKKCLVGAYILDDGSKTLPESIRIASPPVEQTVRINSTSGLQIGSVLLVDPGRRVSDTVIEEEVIITGLDNSANTITALFRKPHDSNTAARVENQYVASIDANSNAVSKIGNAFAPLPRGAFATLPDGGHNQIKFLAASENYTDILCCVTINERIWNLENNRWIEIPRPNYIPPTERIASITIDRSLNTYVIFERRIISQIGGRRIDSPLFKLDIRRGSWYHQYCARLPMTNSIFGRIVPHPRNTTDSQTLFAFYGSEIFKLKYWPRGGTPNVPPQIPPDGGWLWEPIWDNLPRQKIIDLWIGETKQVAEDRKVILRAAVAFRGVWELEITDEVKPPRPILYVRDNVLDHPLLSRSPGGIPNPFHPSQTIRHYYCEDIKIDSQYSDREFYQIDPRGPLPFYQRGPRPAVAEPGSAVAEPGSPPRPSFLHHTFFEELKDNNQNLPSHRRAFVHVQVHNYSNIKANGVFVWPIYCKAGARLPALNKLRNSTAVDNSFDFWRLFDQMNGTIEHTRLTDRYEWQSIGPPVQLSGIDAAHPKVASWLWEIPSLSTGQAIHGCIGVFIHSRENPLDVRERSQSIDDIVPKYKQIGQKNLHIVRSTRGG